MNIRYFSVGIFLSIFEVIVLYGAEKWSTPCIMSTKVTTIKYNNKTIHPRQKHPYHQFFRKASYFKFCFDMWKEECMYLTNDFGTEKSSLPFNMYAHDWGLNS